MPSATRRSFLSGAAVSGAAALHAAQAGRPALPRTRISPLDGVQRQNIKITGVRLISLAYRLKPDEEWADGGNNMIIYKTESVIAEVSTDAGLKGIGACSRYNGPAAMKEYLEKVVQPLLLGKNPFDVEALSGGIAGHGPRGVWAGVDVALWDIIGKATGRPLYDLLATDNEPQTRIRAYASGGEFSWHKGSRFPGPDDLIDQAMRHKAAGYTAFKFRPGAAFERFGSMEEHIANIRRLRAAVGPDFDLIQESNQRWSVPQCLEIAPVLEELKFLWWEEPTRKVIDDYLTIRKSLHTVKISGGETVPNRAQLVEWMDSGAYDIVQPGSDDGGLTECWHQARMAHTRGKLICPHNWQDNLVAIANAHLLAAVPNRFLLESNMTPNPLKEGLFKEWFGVKEGYFELPQKPGLGVELKEGLEEMYPPIEGNWNEPDPDMPPAPPNRSPVAPITDDWPSRPGRVG
ncbi:MAG TPA: mandelate racemase/muconate lactonizing enzyme family protein [Bryobacteraceae bacterium]|nr:mandelate racemase/muconate lactonizing enzyme family protein [Bryobacteraceae bacterium]